MPFRELSPILSTNLDGLQSSRVDPRDKERRRLPVASKVAGSNQSAFLACARKPYHELADFEILD